MKSYTRMDTAYGVVELTLIDDVTVALTANREPIGAQSTDELIFGQARLGPDDVDALIHTLQGKRAKMRRSPE
jgi:hypothetical protein